tara:strand:+ start:550 stop:933 length:384 start_codon:yes stop_codon:yes gene_type:complete
MQDFISQILSEPFEWGRNDCCSIADRWVEQSTGKSPAKISNYHYTTEDEARAIIRAAGGMGSMMEAAMRLAGFERTRHTATGDVGLVLKDRELCMAVSTGLGWFSRNEKGAMLVRKQPVRAWGTING